MTDKFTISFGSQQISTFELAPIATDQKTVAERKWQGRTLAPKPQRPCDIGLFSDDAKQRDLF